MHRERWAPYNARFENGTKFNQMVSLNFESLKFNLTFWNNLILKINSFIDLYFNDYKAKTLILQKKLP